MFVGHFAIAVVWRLLTYVCTMVRCVSIWRWRRLAVSEALRGHERGAAKALIQVEEAVAEATSNPNTPDWTGDGGTAGLDPIGLLSPLFFPKTDLTTFLESIAAQVNILRSYLLVAFDLYTEKEIKSAK